MKTQTLLCGLAPLLCASGGLCHAETFVYDLFDDGQLDPRWSVGFEQEGTGWSYNELGSLLTVSDVFDAGVSSTMGGDWGVTTMSQLTPALGDFNAHMDFSWDSLGSTRAMQRLVLRLGDGDGNMVAAGIYHDAWIDARGAAVARIGDGGNSTGKNSLGHAGSTSLDIVRIGDLITVSWGDDVLFTGNSSAPVERISIEFWHYAYDNVVQSHFGNEIVDTLSLTGAIIPAPAAGVLLLGTLAAGRRRRR